MRRVKLRQPQRLPHPVQHPPRPMKYQRPARNRQHNHQQAQQRRHHKARVNPLHTLTQKSPTSDLDRSALAAIRNPLITKNKSTATAPPVTCPACVASIKGSRASVPRTQRVSMRVNDQHRQAKPQKIEVIFSAIPSSCLRAHRGIESFCSRRPHTHDHLPHPRPNASEMGEFPPAIVASRTPTHFVYWEVVETLVRVRAEEATAATAGPSPVPRPL